MKNQRALLGFLSGALAVGTYWDGASRCGLVFDDHNAIEKNPDVLWSSVSQFDNDGGMWKEEKRNTDAAPGSWHALWTNDFWGRPLTWENSHKSYRPLTVTTFRLERLMFGNGTETVEFMHRVNVLLHGAVTGLVCMLGESDSHGFAASLLFGLHPVHVEAVVGVVGRADLLCSIFYLLCFLSVTKLLPVEEEANKEKGKDSKIWGWGICAVVFFWCACLCKEVGVSVALLTSSLAVGQLIVERNWWHRRAWLVVCGSVICLGGYLAVRHILCEGLDLDQSQLVRKSENPFKFVEPGLLKLLSLHAIWLKYAELLIAPVHLCMEYSYNCLPMVESWEDPRVPLFAILDLTLLCCFCQAIFLVFVRKQTRVAMEWGWFVVPFLPASHVLFTVGTLVAERLLYLPSVGFCLLAARVGQHFMSRHAGLVMKLTPIVPILALYWSICSRRIPEWENDKALVVAGLSVCPASAKLHSLSFHHALNDGNITKARGHLEQASRIHSDWCDLDFFHGELAMVEGNQSEAAERMIAALDCVYTAKQALSILRGMWAIRSRQHRLSNQPDAGVLFEPGIVYEKAGQVKAAVEKYREAVVVAASAKDSQTATKIYKRVLQIYDGGPVDDTCYIAYYAGLASVEAFKTTKLAKELDTAEAYFQHALSCQSSQFGGVNGLVTVYTEQANLSPDDPTVYAKFARVLAFPIYRDLEASDLKSYARNAVIMWQKCVNLAESGSSLYSDCIHDAATFGSLPKVQTLLHTP